MPVRALPILPALSFLAPALLGALGGVAPAPLAAQAALDQVRQVGPENAERYFAPAARGLVFALTAGVFDRATALPAFHVDLGVRVAGAVRGEDTRSFDAFLPERITWSHPSAGTRTFENPYAPVDGDLRTPSVIGRGPGIILEPTGAFRNALVEAGENPEGYRLALPPGLDLALIPVANLYVSVGVGFGTELTLRFLPGLEVSPDLGGFSGRGFAVKHELSSWLDSPVDLAVGVGSQSLSVDDFFEASTLEGWLLAGRALGPLTVYGTAGLRQGSIRVDYMADNPEALPGRPTDGTVVRFSPDVGTQTAWGGGVRLQLLLLNLSGQYTTGDPTSFSIKVALGIP